jgi:hypothetical protein
VYHLGQISELTWTDLEISRPNRGGKDRGGGGRRRSRSPDPARSRTDRYSGNGRERERERENRRSRDDYRPNRSPSPRGHRRGRSPDLYDGRRRSRSRSPYRDHRGGRRDEDDLPLPRRFPRDVPDVQIIAVEDISRDFIGYVESFFKKRGLRTDALFLSARLPEDAVMRRQIIEGVLAVIRLTRINQLTGKIPVRMFDRSAGAENVKFEGMVTLINTRMLTI